MIRIAICEDERPLRELLQTQLFDWKKEIAVETFDSPEELLAADIFDLYFLDIELSRGMDGMELAQRLRQQRGREPVIIFVTGHEQYVYKAFDVEAFAYLLKPVEPGRLLEVCERAAERICERGNKSPGALPYASVRQCARSASTS